MQPGEIFVIYFPGMLCGIPLMIKLRVLVFVLLFALLVSCQGKPQVPFIQRNTNFPPLSNGDVFNLSKLNLAEKDTLYLNFFAPDCKLCVQELPDIIEFHKIAQELYPNVEFLGMAAMLATSSDFLTTEEISPEIETFAKLHRLEYKIYLSDAESLERFNVTGFPETFVFQKNSKGEWILKRKYISIVSLADLEKYARRE